MDCTVTNSEDRRAKKQSVAFLDSGRKESVGFQHLCANALFVLQHKVGKLPQVARSVCLSENVRIRQQR